MSTKTAEERALERYFEAALGNKDGGTDMRIGYATCIREQVEPLEEWKESAIKVMGEWDKVYEALGKPGKLGESMAAASLAEVAKLRALVQGILDLSFHDTECSIGMGRKCDCMKWVIDARAKELGFIPTNTTEG